MEAWHSPAFGWEVEATTEERVQEARLQEREKLLEESQRELRRFEQGYANLEAEVPALPPHTDAAAPA